MELKDPALTAERKAEMKAEAAIVNVVLFSCGSIMGDVH